MIRYDELKQGASFSISFHGIKTMNNDNELNCKYSLKAFQLFSRKAVTFIKDDEDSCHQSVTNTIFKLNGNKMISEEIGLYFFGGYVDDGITQKVEPKIICEYFKEAALSNRKGKQLEMKQNI